MMEKLYLQDSLDPEEYIFMINTKILQFFNYIYIKQIYCTELIIKLLNKTNFLNTYFAKIWAQ